MAYVKLPVRTRKIKGGRFESTIYLRCDDGSTAAISALGKSPAGAMMKASALASQLAKSEIFRAIAPPGTAAAIKAAGMLARAVKAGKVGKVLKKFTGKGAKRLIKKLKFW